jgi:cytochrome b6-f complex iron-sulfur subunit
MGESVPLPDPEGVTRRKFLAEALGVTGVLAFAGLIAPIIRYAYPVVHGQVNQRVKVANVAQLTPNGLVVDFDYQDTPCTLLQLEDKSYVALSRVCTHLGCVIKWQPDNKRFFCPCHAGVFAPTGKVVSGPPPRPLPRLKVTVQASDIWVDGWESA